MLSSRRSFFVATISLALLSACSGTDDAMDTGSTGDSADEVAVSGKSGPGFLGAFASPTIVREGNRYHGYFAMETIDGKKYNVPHTVFDDKGNFTKPHEALPRLGKHAKQDDVVWAPAVAQIDANHWVMYYTATLEGTPQKKCIWRARSNDANGPFVDDFDGPIECPDGSQWAIDPYLVQGEGGAWHLAARIDLPGGINTIQVRRLDDAATHYAAGSEWKLLTHNEPSSWEQPVLENAGLVRLVPPGGGKAHWFVFYSGRAWADDSYAIGYADCGETMDGEDRGAGNSRCKKMTPDGPWLHTNANDKLYGPGTPTFYTNEAGYTLMSVQAWQHQGGKANKKNNGQIMHTYEIHVDNSYGPHVSLVRTDL